MDGGCQWSVSAAISMHWVMINDSVHTEKLDHPRIKKTKVVADFRYLCKHDYTRSTGLHRIRLTMVGNVRDVLLDMGMDLGDVNKAIKHFGPGIQAEQAVDWILEGCQGYVEYAPPLSQVPHPSTQVVPYVGPQANPSSSSTAAGQSHLQPHHYQQAYQNDNTGWYNAFRETELTETDIASSMLALKDPNNNAGRNNTGTNRYRSDSIITQPATDVWELPASDIGRPYSQLPPPIEDVHSSNIPTIGLSNTDDTKGISAPRASPVDTSSFANNKDSGSQTPQEDGDADLRRAIELSLEESKQQTAGSADMSRAASKSRLQQEEDDMAAAMSQSILYADQQASATSIKEQDPMDTRLRSGSDTPVIIVSPSSFLAYLPPMMHTFYYNPIFRKVVLELEFDFIQDATFEKYASDSPVLTRSLLPEGTPDCNIKLAALQRLFIFLAQSSRAKTGLVDIMDAFAIKVPTAARNRDPLPDMKGRSRPFCFISAAHTESSFSTA